MQFGILLLLAAFPILELALLIKLGQVVGFWGTLLLIVLTGMLGLLVIQRQGLAMMARLRDMLASGRPSPDVDFEGALLILSGILLLLPGPTTDFCGLLLMLPPVRNALGRWIRSRVQVFTSVRPETAATQGPNDTGPIIEGEFQRIDERNIKPGPTNGTDRGH